MSALCHPIPMALSGEGERWLGVGESRENSGRHKVLLEYDHSPTALVRTHLLALSSDTNREKGATGMSQQLDLSIFTFERRATAPASPNEPAAGASNVLTAEVDPDPIPVVIVDLENLTPENLAAFFPSEHATL